MKLKRRSRAPAEIDLGTFADIVFLIIIFFVLTTTLIKPSYEELEVPSGTSDPKKKKQKQLTIHLNADGILYGRKETSVSLAELRQRLEKEKFLAKEEKDRMVILDSSENVDYGTYYEVVMSIDRAGGILALVEHKEEKSE